MNPLDALDSYSDPMDATNLQNEANSSPDLIESDPYDLENLRTQFDQLFDAFNRPELQEQVRDLQARGQSIRVRYEHLSNSDKLKVADIFPEMAQPDFGRSTHSRIVEEMINTSIQLTDGVRSFRSISPQDIFDSLSPEQRDQIPMLAQRFSAAQDLMRELNAEYNRAEEALETIAAEHVLLGLDDPGDAVAFARSSGLQDRDISSPSTTREQLMERGEAIVPGSTGVSTVSRLIVRTLDGEDTERRLDRGDSVELDGLTRVMVINGTPTEMARIVGTENYVARSLLTIVAPGEEAPVIPDERRVSSPSPQVRAEEPGEAPELEGAAAQQEPVVEPGDPLEDARALTPEARRNAILEAVAPIRAEVASREVLDEAEAYNESRDVVLTPVSEGISQGVLGNRIGNFREYLTANRDNFSGRRLEQARDKLRSAQSNLTTDLPAAIDDYNDAVTMVVRAERRSA